MIERTPLLNIVTHAVLIFGALLLAVPIWLSFVAATLTVAEVNSPNVHYLPGGELWNNLTAAWTRADFGVKFMNSMIVAIAVVIGKVAISAISAFSIVFFNYRLRMVFFWVIFITLMLPLEVRIVPTYAVAANALYPFQAILDFTGISWLIAQFSGVELSLEWNMLNSYTGLILPLVATATGTFLYRQFFLTIPDELVEAAKMDGSGPFRFFFEVLLPLSRTNIAALATIMFVYAWNQYLWPLLIITDRANYSTVVMELRRLIPGPDAIADWNVAMAGTLIVMLPPLLVVILMQRWFVRGLISTEK
ncbi:ABC transporter permease subunit [Nitratireductor aquimarinus]|uniref:sn-glycerol-3-phosphate transport system permease protein UgpE n=1 Tax=Nitratireductor aquimarinus TaxID=889300 RepID=A0ABU4AMT4_9HYPH|nr:MULTISPECIES: ABC transporter permease subunit [Alphaproteobacteria]MBY6023059.1 ABC transporter permease subunit [Nitratireductor sp. DP7N14-4]MBN7758266.1 ABC transporter permease subunit [Nitratireductor aquimarinus]MBY6001027.1 ABC transporter permease subunit [Tritonibacter mobilis]MCV0349491.1 ABC transporter permease subunit [Nitratireductor sp.]MCV0378683.1 ABC transporter permease subunit [Nitratireductor sp.]